MHQNSSIVFLCLVPLTIGWTTSRTSAQVVEPAENEDAPAPDFAADISAEAQAAVEQGVKLLEQKRYKEAINTFLVAVQRHPTNGPFRHLLGVAYAQDKQLARAWLLFRQSVRMNPNYQPGIRDFLALWEASRRRGLFNVGQTPRRIQDSLGSPDKEQKEQDDGNKLIWEYGFMRINFVDGKLVSILDPRGLDPATSQPNDAIKLKFDGRSWRLAFRAIDRLQSLAEYVPADQSVQNWEELFTVQRLYGMTARRVSPKQMMERIEQDLTKDNAGAVFEVLASRDKDVLFQWQDKGTGGGTAQHEIVRLVAGERDIIRLAYTRTVAQLSPQDAAQWRNLLQQAELVAR